MNKLILNNLLHRPMRAVIGIAAVAMQIIMILAIAAIMLGQIDNQTTQASGIGADMIVRPPNSSFLSAVGGAPVPAKISKILEKLPHIAVAAPVITDLSVAGSVETIWGIDFASYNALRPFKFLEGGPFTGPNDVIVDDYFALADKGHKIGEVIKVKGQPFRICGIVEHGKGGRKFVPIHTLGGLMGNADNASIFYVRSENKDYQNAIRDEIHAAPGMSQYQVQTLDEWMSLMTPSHFPGFTYALNSVIGIAVIVGFLVIFQTMYAAVMERTREIGILKSLGASRGTIVSVVLRETAVIAILGVALGLAGTEMIRLFIHSHFPTLTFSLSSDWRLRASSIAIAGAILGSLYPAFKAARKDPIDALAYE